MSFLRFVGNRRNADSGVEMGLFEISFALADHKGTSDTSADAIREQLAWFAKNLPKPVRFNRTRSKGYYRRNTRGICWFKDSATECLSRMRVLQEIAEAHGHNTKMISEQRIGYVVYEDDFQVVAEPFNDTRTG